MLLSLTFGTLVALTGMQLSAVRLHALQGSDTVYFPAEQYDTQAIRSSAATVEEFILQTRLQPKGQEHG